MCKNESGSLFEDDAEFLAWINGKDLIIEMVDMMLNTLSLRYVFEIQAEMSNNFLAIWVLILGER